MTTRTRITMLIIAVVLIGIGSVLYSRPHDTLAVDQPLLQADRPKIDTTPPKPLNLGTTIDDLAAAVKLGMTEADVTALFGGNYVTVQQAESGNPMWRYDFADGPYRFTPSPSLAGTNVAHADETGLRSGAVNFHLMIEWEEPNRSGNVEVWYLDEKGGVTSRYLIRAT